MTGPIDEAFVEIKPDLKNFDRDMERGLDRSFDRLEDKLDDVVDVIERQFSELIKTLHIHFEALEDKADRAFEQVEDSARDAAISIANDIERGTRAARDDIDDLADSADRDFDRIERKSRGSGFSIAGMFTSIGRSIGGLLSKGLESLTELGGKIGSSLGSTIGQVGSSIGTVTGGIGGIAQFAVIGTLVPLALGLAGALSQLAGALAALPAAAGVAAAAILPLVLAFHGFGDAIGAVLANDPEKLNEALKKLSPSAASVVREFQKLVKPFGEIQKLAQEALFKPLVGTLTQLANVVLPALRTGVPLVASAFGNMFAQIGKLFANAETTGVLNKLFASTASIINGMTPSIVHLVDVLGTLFVQGLPFVERFFGVISGGINSFATWLEKAIDGDKIVGWLDKAWHVGTLVWDILKGIVIYFGTLLGSFADEGTDTLEGIAAAIQKMNEYLKSDEGAETLHNLGVLIHWAGNAFVWFLGTLTSAWRGLNAFFSFVRGIGPFIAGIGRWFSETWTSITTSTSNAWTNIKNFIVNTWNSIVSGVQTFIANVVIAIQSFPSALRRFIVDAIHDAAYQVGYAIGLMIKFMISDLPNAIMGIGPWFMDLWNNLVESTKTGVSNIISWAGQLPGRVWNYVRELQSRVNATLSDLWHSAVNFLKNMVNDAVREAGRLPGRVWDAMRNVGDIAFNIGRDIVSGIVNGMRSLAGWLFNQAKDLANRAWQGAKDALGIASPSKKFAELGRWSAEGFVQGMDKYDMTNEVGSQIKMPLDTFSRQARNTSTAGATSVNVGGASIVAYLQIGNEQLHPVVVTALQEHPQEVALAVQQGDTQLARRR